MIRTIRANVETKDGIVLGTVTSDDDRYFWFSGPLEVTADAQCDRHDTFDAAMSSLMDALRGLRDELNEICPPPLEERNQQLESKLAEIREACDDADVSYEETHDRIVEILDR